MEYYEIKPETEDEKIGKSKPIKEEVKKENDVLLTSKTIQETNKENKNENIKKLVNYEDSLLNKVSLEYMHERYSNRYAYIKGFRDMVQTYLDICNDFSKKIMTSINSKFISDNYRKKQKQINNEKENPLNTQQEMVTFSLNKACEGLLALMDRQRNYFTNLINSLSNELINFPKDFKYFFQEKKEKELYNQYKTILKDYNICKTNFIRHKKEYESHFESLEKINKEIKEAKFDKNKIVPKLNKTIENLKTASDKYKLSSDEIKKRIGDKMKIEKNLLKLYQDVDKNISSKIENIICQFIADIKNENVKSTEQLSNLELLYKEIDIEKDFNYYIEKCIEENKVEKEKEESFEYLIKKLQIDLTLNTISSSEKEIIEFHLKFKIISFLNTNFNDMYKDINLKEEQKKLNLLILMQKMFYPKENNKFVTKDKDLLISLLKSKQIRKIFIIILSNQRTKGRYQQSWKLVNDLGDILRFILNLSEKEKNYEIAKHCLILSQTFYSEKKKTKKKLYLFEYIKNNRWLKSPEFWSGITEEMVGKEIENNNAVLGKEALEKESESQRKERISQVYLSQLFTFTQNMIDLGLTKEDIKAIIDKSSAKFGVVDSIKEAIYENLNNILNSLPKKEVEGQDEIELYIKKRQKTIKNLKRKICINNNIFNDSQKIHETNIQINKEMKKMKSCFLLPSIYKLERNKVFDNIKKEIKNNFERIDKKTKSEKISPKDFKGFDELKDKKIKSEPIKKKEDKNEIIIEEKDEIEEDKKKEIKKEEDKKEEPKKEEIKEKENETDVKKEDNKIEEVKNEIKEN
jgi:hypothetical protein